jgi:hypothetical protein
MSHICANDKYRSQVGATKRPENIVIRYISFGSLSYSFLLVYRSAVAQIFPRSHPMRESNISNMLCF